MNLAMRNWSVLLVMCVGNAVTVVGQAEDTKNPSVANIQRTMSRIAASTPQHPATVRWQFYGQSITAQAWTKLVEEDLVRRFPTVNFIFQNPAIGGFTSPALIRTAEHDLYPWYPDLLVFHVYGPVDKYEEIIRDVRARTTAEIVLWTSHLSAHETLDKDPDADSRIVAIREIARKYECTLIDVRKKWMEVLQQRHLEPSALLSDSVHLNEEGVQLLASLVAPELVCVPSLTTTPQAGEVLEFSLSSPAVSRDEAGNLTLAFTGNRVVAVSDGGGSGTADVLLDGQSMSERRELWAATRPSPAPQMWMPAVKQVSFEQTPVCEKWTLTCLKDSTPDAQRVHFRVQGSVTGDDGEGYSDQRFVSRSGRVVIEPDDWHLAWCLGYKQLQLPANFPITWETYPTFATTYSAQKANTETVLVQNCSNEPHQLTLRGAAAQLALRAFRVYRPSPINSR